MLYTKIVFILMHHLQILPAIAAATSLLSSRYSDNNQFGTLLDATDSNGKIGLVSINRAKHTVVPVAPNI